MPSPISDLPQIADELGAHLPEAIQSGAVQELGQMLARMGFASHLVTALFKEARLKHPRAKRLAAYYALLHAALDGLRIDANGGDRGASESLDFLVDYLAGVVGRGGVEPVILVEIGRAFALAGVAPPEALRATLSALTDQRAEETAHASGSISDLPDIFAELGDDAFAIHEQVRLSSAAFQQRHRFAMAAGLAMSASPGARAAAIGFLLDADPELAGMVGLFLAEKGSEKSVDSRTAERVARLRPWVSPARQPPIDAALRTLRRSARPPASAAPGRIEFSLATPMDGAGAQSLFVVMKAGRKLTLIGFLIKLGQGVVDAWAMTDLTRRRADVLLDHMRMEADAMTVSAAYIETRLADALADNLCGNPPPFGLVQAFELMGTGPVIPKAADFTAMLAEMQDVSKRTDAPSMVGDTILDDVLLDSWFEAGGEVDTLLSPIRGRAKRVAAMLETYLPARRAAWISRLVWTARAVRDASPAHPIWPCLAEAAGDLAAGKPPAGIYLMRVVAEHSVEAHGGR